MENKTCPECGEGIKGRTDKKFCSDMCRNAYNNRINSANNQYVRNVNNVLRRNRRILEECLVGDKIAVPRQKLAEKGYNFKYITGQTVTENAHPYYFCYEFGFQPLANDHILIVRDQPEP